jgi:FkbM family methyltransferase
VKTAHKIAVARVVYRALHQLRKIAGRSDHCVVTRNGVIYDLDLAEGIELAIYLGMFERSTSRVLKSLVKPGDSVLDIGANIGVHTLLMASLVGANGHVYSFEPTVYAERKLHNNLKHNAESATRVSVFHCFLSDVDQDEVPETVYSRWPLTDSEGLHSKHLGLPMPTNGAPSRRLDALLQALGNPKISLVKMDVDGFEVQVLRGADVLLSQTRPTFVMELSPYVLEERGSSLKEFLSFFEPHGYRLFDERTRQLLPYHPERLRSLVPDGSSINVVARVI